MPWKASHTMMAKCLALSSEPVLPLASAMFKGTDSAALLSWSKSSAFPRGSVAEKLEVFAKNWIDFW